MIALPIRLATVACSFPRSPSTADNFAAMSTRNVASASAAAARTPSTASSTIAPRSNRWRWIVIEPASICPTASSWSINMDSRCVSLTIWLRNAFSSSGSISSASSKISANARRFCSGVRISWAAERRNWSFESAAACCRVTSARVHTINEASPSRPAIRLRWIRRIRSRAVSRKSRRTLRAGPIRSDHNSSRWSASIDASAGSSASSRESPAR